jgi:uncharacterized ion transporter superfamily protein YfcC
LGGLRVQANGIGGDPLMSAVSEKPEVRASGLDGNGDPRGKALRRLEKKREFRTHLLAYVLVNAFLWLIWGVVFATTGFWFPWPVFPLFGWAIGLVFHGWDVYGRREFTAEQIDRELARLC